MIKAVHIGTTDEGGAYGAMVRISRCMEDEGLDSGILLRNKRNDSSEGRAMCTGYRRFASKVRNSINLVLSFDRIQTDYLGESIINEKEIKEADIIFLHWTNSFLSYKSVRELKKLGKPVVWVMHDMWLMTGGCHYDNYCEGYMSGCRDCPYTKKRHLKSLAEGSFRRKKEMLECIAPVIVTPSEWLAKIADKSDITAPYEKHIINNPVHTETFHPYCDGDKTEIREKYGIPADDKLILFSAFNATHNVNKGFLYLKEALGKIENEDCSLLICGEREEGNITSIGRVKVRYAGFVKDRTLLAKIYSAADVVAAPSKQENYSGVVLEALACGTPVTAFDLGGMPEIIKHGETGYLAKLGDSDELLKGILFCAANKSSMSDRAREIRVKTNTPKIIGRKYRELADMLVRRGEKNNE